jgi:hypothetical protein
MTNIKLLFLSMFFLTCTKINIPELELTPLTKDILKAISIENDRYNHDENNELFYEIFLFSKSEYAGLGEMQVYLMEYNLNDPVLPVSGHAKYNGLNVITHGELLNNVFWNVLDSASSNFKHRYGTSEEVLYDPPNWTLYFNDNQEIIKTIPEELLLKLNVKE